MAEADVFTWMRPFRGERVLWQGAAAVGASWPSVPRLLRNALLCWIGPLAAFLLIGFLINVGQPPLPDQPSRGSELLEFTRRLAVVLGVLVTLILVPILISKVAGPSYLTFALVALSAPAFGEAWFDLVQTHGWGGALEHSAALLASGAVFLGLPLALLALDVFTRLDTVYVLTDRRVAAVLAWRHVTLWELSRDLTTLDVGFDDPDRTRAHLLVTTRSRQRRLYLRNDDPVAVVALARGERTARDL